MGHTGEKKTFSKIIILGHTGFIGRYIFKKFKQAQLNCAVLGLSSQELDLTDETAVHSLSRILDENTAIIMCSAIKRHVEDSLHAFQSNMKMATNIGRLLLEIKIGRFLYFSSVSIYGEDREDLNMTEDTPIKPITYYGIAKYATECLLRKVAEERGDLLLALLRPSLVYGPGDECEHYRPSGFVKSILTTNSIDIWGDGQEQRDFIYVKDIAELTFQILLSGYEGTLNLVSGTSHSFKEVIENLKNLLPGEIKLNHVPRTRPKVSQRFDNKKLQKYFPDFQFTSFEQGIKETYQIVRKEFISP